MAKACDHCPHIFDPHVIVATTGDPKAGGIIICNVIGCKCFATWSVPQLGSTSDTIYVPPIETVELLRLTKQDTPESDAVFSDPGDDS